MIPHLLRLPAALCALVLLSSYGATAANSTTTAAVGDLVAQGLGLASDSSNGTSGSSTSTSTLTIDETSTIYATASVTAESSQASDSAFSSTSTLTIDETSTIHETSSAASSPLITGSSPSATPASSVLATLNFTAGTQCADDKCAFSCDRLWMAWEISSASFSSSYAKKHGNITIVTTSVETLPRVESAFISPTPAPAPYTLCDDIPRVNATFSLSTYTTTSYYTALPQTITTIAANYTGTPPQCTVNPLLCLDVVLEYYEKHITSGPHCSLPPGYMVAPGGGLEIDDIYGECNLVGGPVRLLYWPVETVGGLCDNRTSTISATPTGDGPNTVLFDGTTLTSPTVYLSFQTLYAISTNTSYWQSNYTTTVGPKYSNVILPEQPDKVSSLCGSNATVIDLSGEGLPYVQGGYYQLNYAKLNQPVHATDYFCAAPQNENVNPPTFYGNSTIYAGNYNPTLLFPTDLVQLNTEWATCSVGTGDWFIFDPPHALTQEASEAGPSRAPATTSTTSPTSTQSAQPASSATALPEVTSTPGPAPQTTTTNPQASSDVVDPISASVAGAPQDSSAVPGLTAAAGASQGASSDPSSTVAAPAGDPGTSVNVGPGASGPQPAGSSTSSADPGGVLASLLGGSAQSSKSEADPAAAQSTAVVAPGEGSGSNTDPAGVIASLLGGQGSGLSQGGSIVQPDGTAATGAADPNAGSPATQHVNDPAATNVVISTAGQLVTLVAGGSQATAIVASATLSLGPAGVVVDGTTTLPAAAVQVAESASSVVLTTAGQVVTLVQGGSQAAVTLGSTTLSLGSAGVVVDGTTTLPAVDTNAADPGTSVVFTTAGQAVTLIENSSQDAATFGSTTYSLGPAGVVADGTSTLAGLGQAGPTSVVFTIAGETITLVENGSQNMATIGSTTYSLGPSGVVVDGTSTIHSSSTPASTLQDSGTTTGAVLGAGSPSSSPSSTKSSGSGAVEASIALLLVALASMAFL